MKRKQTAAQLSRRAQRIILALLERPTAGESGASGGRIESDALAMATEARVSKGLARSEPPEILPGVCSPATSRPGRSDDVDASHDRYQGSPLQPGPRGDECSGQRRTRYRSARLRCALRELETSRPDGFHLDQLDKAA